MPQRRQKINVGGGTIGSTFREVAKPQFDESRANRLGKVLGLVDVGIRTGLEESKKAQAEKGALARQELETEIAHLPPEERQKRVDALRESVGQSTNGFLAAITGAKEATFDEFDRIDATLSADEMHKAINSYVQENQDKVDKDTLQTGIAGLMAEYTSRSKAISEKHFENFAPTAAKVATQWDTSVDKHYFEKQEAETLKKSHDAMNSALNNYVLTISGAASMDQLRNDPKARERMEAALNDPHNIEQISGLAQKYRKGLGATTSLGGDNRTRQVRDQIIKMARDLKNPSLLKSLSLKDSAGRAMSDIDTEMVRGLALDLDSEKRRYDTRLQQEIKATKGAKETEAIYRDANTINAEYQEMLDLAKEKGAFEARGAGKQLADNIDNKIKELQNLTKQEDLEESTRYTAVNTQKILRDLQGKIYENVGREKEMKIFEEMKATQDPGLNHHYLALNGKYLTREALLEGKSIADANRKTANLQQAQALDIEREHRALQVQAPMRDFLQKVDAYNRLPMIKDGGFTFSADPATLREDKFAIYNEKIAQLKDDPRKNNPEFLHTLMVQSSKEATAKMYQEWDARVSEMEKTHNYPINRENPAKSGASIAARANASAVMSQIMDDEVKPADITPENRLAVLEESINLLNNPTITSEQKDRLTGAAVHAGFARALEEEGASGIVDMHSFVDTYIGSGANTPERAYDSMESSVDRWGDKYHAEYPSSAAGLIAGTSTSKTMRFNEFKKDLLETVFTSSGGFGGFFERHTLADKAQMARRLERMKSKYKGKGQDAQMMEFFFRQNGGVDKAIAELLGESEDKPKADK